MSKAKVVQKHIPYGKPQELTNIITHASVAALGFVGLVLLLKNDAYDLDNAVSLHSFGARNYV